MVNHCEKQKLFGDQQSAYISGTCTKTNFKLKGVTATAFLDVEKAFDSVWHERILYKQIQINTPWSIIKWTNSFWSNRKIKVIYNQEVSKRTTPEAGVPQGNIVSPILFNIYVIKTKCKDTSLWQYANDIAIYYTNEKKKQPLNI